MPASKAGRRHTAAKQSTGKSTARNIAGVPAEKFEQLASLVDTYDDHTRLLFHLERFVSLVYYDPAVAKADHSDSFEDWNLSHDVWEAAAGQESSRAGRKKVQRVKKIVEEVTANAAPKPAEAPTNGSLKRKASKIMLQKEVHSKSRPSPKKRYGLSGASSKRTKLEYETEEVSSESEYTFDSHSEDFDYLSDVPDDQLPHAKRVSFHFDVPEPTVAHPAHIARPQFSGNLDAFLEDFRVLDESDLTLDQWQQHIDAEARSRAKVAQARKSGLLEELERLGTGEDSVIPKFVDPQVRPVFWDSLVNHGLYLAKIRSNNRKLIRSNIRKNAQAVEQYFRRLAGAEEKERKDLERNLRQLARKIGADVLKKWKLAEKVVEQRRQQVLQEENKIKGKQYLNQILEQSAQLLESRLESYAPEDDTDLSSQGEEYGLQQPTPSDSDSASDQFSDSDDEHEQGDDLDDDAKLSVEQLRDKYNGLPAESNAPVSKNLPVSPLRLEKPSDQLLELYEQEVAMEESEDPLSESESDASLSDADGEPPGRSKLASLFGQVLDDESDDSGSDRDGDVVVRYDNKASEKLEADEADTGGQLHIETAESVSESHTDGVAIDEESHVNDDGDAERITDIQSGAASGLSKIGTPFLLRGKLREYQQDGLDWLAGLYNSQSNGILADEMGLGKTIQTIALLAYLACEKHIWGPHLIIVPTSVMLNWEMEFKRFAPGFKVLTYYGNPQQRKDKRRGWNKDDTWHVCITSYQLVIQDQVAFKRKKWVYMILDEAHNIKNFRSQRWQALLNFNSERRLLLTGTPLQNNLVELWSLLYFLMPSSRGTQMMPDGFANLEDFQEWFARPVDQMVEEGEEADSEAKMTISKLHQVLRPYLLRRLKADVEKQMPGKYEHVVYTRLSKRQRYLYDDFMSRAATKETLASANFMSILNCLMQLRKVCNHPNLFEVRPIVTSLALEKSIPHKYVRIAQMLNASKDPSETVNFDALNLIFPNMENRAKWEALSTEHIRANQQLALILAGYAPETVYAGPDYHSLEQWAKHAVYKKRMDVASRRQHSIYLNMFRTKRVPIYGVDLRQAVQITPFTDALSRTNISWDKPKALARLCVDYENREKLMQDPIVRYSFVTPPVVCLDAPELHCGILETASDFEKIRENPLLHESQVRLSVAFPDKRLLQYDCGKLQTLAILLRDLISEGHRALIFTQMTRVLDVLEQFLNIHGWRYLRLDGATRIEERQLLTERFNKDASIPVFILSTRSGGLGINLTGADTVIFYDSDWNPAMDRQCQDRCHRIGQTRDVHIYRLVSEYTIESNILRKATQKTILDNVVIQEGDFTTDYFNRMTVQDLLGDNAGRSTSSETLRALGDNVEALAQAEDADDAAAASMAMSEARMDAEEFAGDKGDKGEVSREASQAPSQAPSQDVAAVAAAPDASSPTPVAEGIENDDIGHVDDYMIKFIERDGI